MHWKYCKFQDLGAPKDCKVLGGPCFGASEGKGQRGGKRSGSKSYARKLLRQLILVSL